MKHDKTSKQLIESQKRKNVVLKNVFLHRKSFPAVPGKETNRGENKMLLGSFQPKLFKHWIFYTAISHLPTQIAVLQTQPIHPKSIWGIDKQKRTFKLPPLPNCGLSATQQLFIRAYLLAEKNWTEDKSERWIMATQLLKQTRFSYTGSCNKFLWVCAESIQFRECTNELLIRTQKTTSFAIAPTHLPFLRLSCSDIFR